MRSAPWAVVWSMVLCEASWGSGTCPQMSLPSFWGGSGSRGGGARPGLAGREASLSSLGWRQNLQPRATAPFSELILLPAPSAGQRAGAASPRLLQTKTLLLLYQMMMQVWGRNSSCANLPPPRRTCTQTHTYGDSAAPGEERFQPQLQEILASSLLAGYCRAPHRTSQGTAVCSCLRNDPSKTS